MLSHFLCASDALSLTSDLFIISVYSSSNTYIYIKSPVPFEREIRRRYILQEEEEGECSEIEEWVLCKHRCDS